MEIVIGSGLHVKTEVNDKYQICKDKTGKIVECTKQMNTYYDVSFMIQKKLLQQSLLLLHAYYQCNNMNLYTKVGSYNQKMTKLHAKLDENHFLRSVNFM